MQTSSQIPWPGPKPYEEADWERFFGREEYVDKLLHRLAPQRLSVLLGASGSGKTSLIRAGLVPLLRNRRYHPASTENEGPVLVFRGWGATPKDTARDLVEQQVQNALGAIADWHRRFPGHAGAGTDVAELQALFDKHKGQDVVLLIEALARGVADLSATRRPGRTSESPALVLVFDQLEELLRARDRQSEHETGRLGKEILSLVGELYSRDAPLQMLLSMRVEYLFALRPLDDWVARLSERSMFLGTLKPADAREVVARVCEATDAIGIDEDILEAVLPSSEGTQSSADLLKLQAVLHALSSKAQEMGTPVVNRIVYDAYLESAGRHTRWHEDDVFQHAVEQWIEGAVDGSTVAIGGDTAAAVTAGAIERWKNLPAADINRQVRRTALRIASHLSSSDYKVPQEVSNLFRRALGAVVAMLTPENATLVEKAGVELVSAAGDGRPARVSWESEDAVPHGETAERNRSGTARADDWTAADTADVIASCYQLTLQRFQERNILRFTYSSRNEAVCELVHDQMGPMLVNWAERRRSDWIDSTSTLVALSGGPPITCPDDVVPPGAYAYLTWRGCTVQPRSQARLRFEAIVFERCELRGQVFDRCVFRDVRFDECALNGTIFRDCVFEPGADGRSVVIGNSKENALDCLLFLDCKIAGLEFRDCVVRQPSFVNSRLEGDVLFEQCAVAQLYATRVTGDAKIHIPRSSKAWCCSADEISIGRLDARKAVHGAATVAEPDDLVPGHLASAQS